MAWTKVKDGLFVGDRDSIQVILLHLFFPRAFTSPTTFYVRRQTTATVFNISLSQDYDLLEPNSITYFCNCAAGELDFFWEGVEFLTFHWEDHPAYTYFDEGGIVVRESF